MPGPIVRADKATLKPPDQQCKKKKKKAAGLEGRKVHSAYFVKEIEDDPKKNVSYF